MEKTTTSEDSISVLTKTAGSDDDMKRTVFDVGPSFPTLELPKSRINCFDVQIVGRMMNADVVAANNEVNARKYGLMGCRFLANTLQFEKELDCARFIGKT